MYFFEEKVKYLVRVRNMTMKDFAERMGMQRAAVYELIKRPVIRPEIVAKVCHILNIDKTFFEIKEKYPALDNISAVMAQEKAPEPYSRSGNIIYVPLVAYGGFLQGYSNKVYVDSLSRFNLPGITGEHYAFEVDGMSMYDLAAPGDFAIAKPEEKLEYMVKGKTYVLQTIDGILIKIFDKITGEQATFHSFNKDYDGLTLPLKSLKRVYFVSRILKKI